MTVPILILAGGASSRMEGRDKLLETVDGEPLLSRITRIACEVSGDVTVLLRPNEALRREALNPYAVDVIEPEDALEGMSGSLRAGFAHLANRTSPVLLLLADLPELEASDLHKVISAQDKAPKALVWRGATENVEPGHPILFAAALFPAFADLRGDGGGKEVIAAAKGRVHLVPLTKNRARLDLDTPGEWASWRAATGR